MNLQQAARELRSLNLPAPRQRQLVAEAAHSPSDAARALLVSRARYEAQQAVQASAEAFEALQATRAAWAARNPHEVRRGCPDDHPHGTTGTCFRKHDCRCDSCVGAQRARMETQKRKQRDATQRPVQVKYVVPTKPDAVRVQKRPEKVNSKPVAPTRKSPGRPLPGRPPVTLPPGKEHGLPKVYWHFKCRCDACTLAVRAYNRSLNERKKAQKEEDSK